MTLSSNFASSAFSPSVYVRFLMAGTCALTSLLCCTVSGDEAYTAADHAAVQSLIRIDDASLNKYPQASGAVQRYLSAIVGSDVDEFLRITKRLSVRSTAPELQKLVARLEIDVNSVTAAELLMQFGEGDRLRALLSNSDDRLAAASALALGSTGWEAAVPYLLPIVNDQERQATVRTAAATGLGRNAAGQRALLEMARRDAVPAAVLFSVADALLGSYNDEVRTSAEQIDSLKPVESEASAAIPPINTLLRMRGDGKAGKLVFETKGECAKCHKVHGEGKDVGPDLSEIGSKLSRQDMYVAILNPSAAISHNYETFGLLTVDGTVITGLKVNETDEAVTLKTADALVKTVSQDDIEELKMLSTSMMPADLQKKLTTQSLLDLVDYLVLLKKPEESGFHVLATADDADVRPSRDAKDATAGIDVADDLAIQLFAAEPLLRNPTSIDVDHLGRVWVAETINYRHFRNPYNTPRPEGDRIVVIEDTDSDGVADKQTVFYQGTDIDSPHGVCVLGNRVIVSAGANVFLFTDSDGDLVPDSKQALFTGIDGTQHDHGIHSFMPGPDGKLYFNFGNAGKQLRSADGSPIVDRSGTVVDSSRSPYQEGMVFRCEPDGSNLETLGWNFRNNWEVCVDSFGTMWQSDNDDDGNRAVRINYVMPYGNYGYRDELTGATWQAKRIGMRSELGQRHWHLNDPGVVPNVLQTGAGSPTGICIYEGDLLPARLHGQMIHCDPGPNVVRSYPVTKDGAGYEASLDNIAVGTRDQWFRPVDACTAPDGSVVVADWYDPGVGGHRMGDSDRGRLFRIVPKKHAKYEFNPADFSTPEGALVALDSPNQSTRFLAGESIRRMILTGMTIDIESIRRQKSPRQRARLLWILITAPETEQTRRQIKSAIAFGLQDADEDVRLATIRAAVSVSLLDAPSLRKLAASEFVPIRREVAIALRHDRPEDPAIASEIWGILASQHDGVDRWYLEALGIAADGHWDAYLRAYLARVGDDWDTPAGRDILWRSRAKTTCDYLGKIISRTPNATDQQRYFRALEFHQGPPQQAALMQTLARATVVASE